MEVDSNIIHFTTWSLNNSPDNRSKSSSISSNTDEKEKNSKNILRNSSTKSKASIGDNVKREIGSFCCVCCHLTFKSCKFHSLKVYLLLICLISIFTNMIAGAYISSIITSLQTQYNLSTAKIGYIIASFDVMGIFATPLISYLGTRYNKARIISICNMVYSIGCMVFILPYFFGARYELANQFKRTNSTNFLNQTITNNASIYDLCRSQSNLLSGFDASLNFSLNRVGGDETLKNQLSELNDECYRASIVNQWPLYAFIGGQLLMSWGIAPLFPLGITYLSDNMVEKCNKQSIYTGIFYASTALGPAVGYLLGSFFLSFWINITEKAPINADDPRWVGMWYLGLIVSAVAVLISSFILMSFPAKISRTTLKHYKRKKVNQRKKKSKDIVDISSKKTLETIDENAETKIDKFKGVDSISAQVSDVRQKGDSISQTVSYLSDNTENKKFDDPNNALVVHHKKRVFSCLFWLKVKGFLKSFWSLLSNFRYTLLVLIMSVEAILIAAFTTYMVFYSQHVYQQTPSTASILTGGILVPSAILGAIIGGWIVYKFNLDIEGCTNLFMINSIVVAGFIFLMLFVHCDGDISDGIDLTSNSFNLSFVCDADCDCSKTYDPTCGVNNVSYLSPCFAGCKTRLSDGYYNCGCIVDSLNLTDHGNLPSAQPGACRRECSVKQAIFLVSLFVIVFLESLSLTPITILLLKLVDKELQPLALGVLRMANILIAYIPAPIFLSHFIDQTCVLWNFDCTGDKGTCLEYNITSFHNNIFGISLVVKSIACVMLVIFSAHIHRSFLLKRRFQRKAHLNHDLTSVLTPKQKYMIDSEVASLNSDLFKEEKKTKSKVVLQRLTYKDIDNFTSFDRSQTPEFFIVN